MAFEWYLKKINKGYKTLEYQGDVPVYVVYSISQGLSPVLTENNAGTSSQYLQILSYGSEQNAAMLPLL